MLAEMPEDWKRENAFIADGFHAMPYELQMRFGLWKELLAEPEPPAYFPIARTLRHAGQGVAYAALGKTKEARASQKAFHDSAAAVPQETIFGNNTAHGLFDVADRLLEGEILFREGKRAAGLAALREAAAKEDQLRYDEPPSWPLPTRHFLGQELFEAGKLDEAEGVYREDLKRHPENGWALFGLAQTLSAKKSSEAAAVKKRFAKAWARADVKLAGSRF